MQTIDLLNPSHLARVVCRPALPRDTPDVMELTRHIWEGHDYIPYVWAKWLADPQGLLAVVEYGSHVVGLAKLTRLSPTDWWMEGLRVHPQYKGRRIASHLNDYLLDYWLRYGAGAVRLVTAAFRVKVHHIAERSGFKKVGEFGTYSAPALPESSPSFHPAAPDEVSRVLDFTVKSASLSLSHGLMDTGWQWHRPSIEHLAVAIKAGQAWWWRKSQGFLTIGEDTDDDGAPFPYIQLLACPMQAIAEMLVDCRRLAGSLGYARVDWTAPLHPDLQPALAAVGFLQEWEHSAYLFEKFHPKGVQGLV